MFYFVLFCYVEAKKSRSFHLERYRQRFVTYFYFVVSLDQIQTPSESTKSRNSNGSSSSSLRSELSDLSIVLPPEKKRPADDDDLPQRVAAAPPHNDGDGAPIQMARFQVDLI